MTITKARPGRRSTCRIDSEGRECTACGKYKPWAEYFKSRATAPGGRTSKCQECWRAAYPVWEHTPESLFRQSLVAIGVDPDDYTWLSTQQGGVCALCQRPETWKHPKSGALYRLAVDHDHSCKRHGLKKACRWCIRGLLCRNCNRMIGHAEEAGPLVTVRFADYLGLRPLLARGGDAHAALL